MAALTIDHDSRFKRRHERTPPTVHGNRHGAGLRLAPRHKRRPGQHVGAAARHRRGRGGAGGARGEDDLRWLAELLQAQLADNQIYTAHLTGENEVPTNLSQGQGQALFWLNEDGTAIEYKLIAANIDNIFQSHIHNAAAGANGPIVVWLYPDAPPAQLIVGPFQGVLASGSIESSEILSAGNLAGVPVDARLNALLAEMAAGRTYVNVHTTDNDPATGPAPGDIPGGEIRGQIQ